MMFVFSNRIQISTPLSLDDLSSPFLNHKSNHFRMIESSCILVSDGDDAFSIQP